MGVPVLSGIFAENVLICALFNCVLLIRIKLYLFHTSFVIILNCYSLLSLTCCHSVAHDWK